MTDIVERLQETAIRWAGYPRVDLWCEAADEIERLRELRATDLELREADRAEIERLRVRVADLEDQLLQALGERPKRREGI